MLLLSFTYLASTLCHVHDLSNVWATSSRRLHDLYLCRWDDTHVAESTNGDQNLASAGALWPDRLDLQPSLCSCTLCPAKGNSGAHPHTQSWQLLFSFKINPRKLPSLSSCARHCLRSQPLLSSCPTRVWVASWLTRRSLPPTREQEPSSCSLPVWLQPELCPVREHLRRPFQCVLPSRAAY